MDSEPGRRRGGFYFEGYLVEADRTWQTAACYGTEGSLGGRLPGWTPSPGPATNNQAFKHTTSSTTGSQGPLDQRSTIP